MSGVAHGAELGHKEVVAPVIRGRVLLNVGKLHKLERQQEDSGKCWKKHWFVNLTTSQ